MKVGSLRRLIASPLANALALDALGLAALGIAEMSTRARDVLSCDPAGRVAGLTLVGLAWFSVRVTPRTSTGHRRVIAVVASLTTLCVGVLHGAGPSVIADVELRVGAAGSAPARELIAASFVALASAWTWATSPATRR